MTDMTAMAESVFAEQAAQSPSQTRQLKLKPLSPVSENGCKMRSLSSDKVK